MCRWEHITSRTPSPTASEAELDPFFALSLELLCIAGLDDGYFKRVNPSWERVLGYTAAELMARPFIEFVHPDDREPSLLQVAGLARGVAIAAFENRFRCKDGSYVLLAWTATPSVERGLLYAAGHDVTARRRAESQIATLNEALATRAASLEQQNAALERMADINGALLNASVDGIRMVDLDGRTVLANSVMERYSSEVFRLPASTTLQEGAMILASRLADPSAYSATLQAMLADPECVTQDEFELSDVARAFQRHTGPIRDAAGNLIGRILVLREVTAERDAARLKSELVATVSHELRTPLTGVLGFAELLTHHDLDAETRKRYAETIQSEAQRLTGLIDDFLDLQKIEAGRFTLALESFDLAELLRHQVGLFSPQSAKHELQLEAPDSPLVMVGDRNRVGQVIANLLSNAIKYSPLGGAVTITATPGEGFTRVGIRDHGLGIPSAQQENVFTRFFRVDTSDTREIGGTGLGLSLCHEIVTAHGGRIGFESSEEDGSTFWFELPSAWCADSEDRRVPPTATEHGAILIVEDDETTRRLVVETLAPDSKGEHALREAGDGLEALEMIAKYPTDAVVLDLALPGMDGFDVIESLVERPEARFLPVVVLTGRALSADERDFLEQRSATVLHKSRFSGEELRRLVRDALGTGERGTERRPPG